MGKEGLLMIIAWVIGFGITIGGGWKAITYKVPPSPAPLGEEVDQVLADIVAEAIPTTAGLPGMPGAAPGAVAPAAGGAPAGGAPGKAAPPGKVAPPSKGY